jgi:serine/threonine protein phosphatase PrpC
MNTATIIFIDSAIVVAACFWLKPAPTAFVSPPERARRSVRRPFRLRCHRKGGRPDGTSNAMESGQHDLPSVTRSVKLAEYRPAESAGQRSRGADGVGRDRPSASNVDLLRCPDGQPPVPGHGVEISDPRGHQLNVADGHDSVLPPRGIQPPLAWLKAIRGFPLDLLLTKDEILIGRSADCDVVLDRETVSRRHCSLTFRSSRWFLCAYETPNGTFHNDGLVTPGTLVQLQSRDVIGISDQILLRLTTPQDHAFSMQLYVGAASARGGRERNEDHYLATPTIVGVADGVGGRQAGGLASQIAIEMLSAAPPSLSLEQLVPAINAAIQAKGSAEPTARNMATTLDAAQLVGSDGSYRMVGVHIGDGLAVLDDGIQLRPLTTAHTLGAQLASRGNPASARHPDRDRLLRAIGLHKMGSVDSWNERAVIGHRYVLTTDGLTKALSFDQFARLLQRKRGTSPQHLAESLVTAASRTARIPASDIDNLTVVVADVVRDLTTKREER